MVLGLPVGTEDAAALIAANLAPLGRALLVLDGCEAVLDGTASLTASLLAVLPGPDAGGHQPRPAGDRRRADHRHRGVPATWPRHLARACGQRPRAAAGRPGAQRRRGAHAGPGDRAVRGRAMPPLRRPAARDRAGGGAARRHVRARPARPPVRAAPRTAPTWSVPSPRAATRCSTRTRRRCSGGSRCWTGPSRCRSCARWSAGGAIAPVRLVRILRELTARGLLSVDRSGPRWRYHQDDDLHRMARELLSASGEAAETMGPPGGCRRRRSARRGQGRARPLPGRDQRGDRGGPLGARRGRRRRARPRPGP